MQWNLFSAYTQTGEKFILDPVHYCPCKEAGQSKQPLPDRGTQPHSQCLHSQCSTFVCPVLGSTTCCVFSVCPPDETKPQFYNVAAADYSKQDAPKIDGLASSFLLSNPELLDYNGFYDACVSLLQAGSTL